VSRSVRIVGLDELIRDLEEFPVKSRPAFKRVVAKGALNIKLAWRRRWSPEIGRPPQNLPHVVRGIGYDTDENSHSFSAQIGVAASNPQAALAHFPEFGSVNNAPMPGGQPSLDEEDPRFVDAVADAAVDYFDGGAR
jgi:hypothetical protein